MKTDFLLRRLSLGLRGHKSLYISLLFTDVRRTLSCTIPADHDHERNDLEFSGADNKDLFQVVYTTDSDFKKEQGRAARGASSVMFHHLQKSKDRRRRFYEDIDGKGGAPYSLALLKDR